MKIQTENQKRIQSRNLAIYEEFNSLTAEGGMKTEITRMLMKKYGLYGESHIWLIRKQVKKQLENE